MNKQRAPGGSKWSSESSGFGALLLICIATWVQQFVPEVDGCRPEILCGIYEIHILRCCF